MSSAAHDTEPSSMSTRSLVRYARPDLEQMSDAILADHANGATLGELAQRHGVSIWAVRQVLSAAGLSGRSRVSDATMRQRLQAQVSAATSSATTGTAREGSVSEISSSARFVRSDEDEVPAAGRAAQSAAVIARPHFSTAAVGADAPSSGLERPVHANVGYLPGAGQPAAPASSVDALSARAGMGTRVLSDAEIRRLRGVRALVARGDGEAAMAGRLTDLIAARWVEGVSVGDLAEALKLDRDAIVAMLRHSGLPA